MGQVNWDKILYVDPSKIKKISRINFDIKSHPYVLDGDWDRNYFNFDDSIIFKSINDLIVNNVKWKDTELYFHMIKNINNGIPQWYCKTESDLIKREQEIIELYSIIKDEGIKPQIDLDSNRLDRFLTEDMITDDIYVAIDRNGEFIFCNNGTHRLSIAKILGLKSVPVKVYVRHKLWEDYRDYIFTMCNNFWKGKTYQPLPHPDFDELVPMWSDERYKIIKSNKFEDSKSIVDIGSLFGHICYRSELDGMDATAVENDKTFLGVMKHLKSSYDMKFRVFDDNVFNLDNRNYDIIVALNIFHHFLKTEEEFNKLIDFLQSLTFKEMFIQFHDINEPQMVGAYVNYNHQEFAKFIMENTKKENFICVGEERDRKIYKIY